MSHLGPAETVNTADVQFRPTSRVRDPSFFTETRTGAYYGKLGYLAGLGRSSAFIAGAMGDCIHPSYVRTLLRRWGIEHRPEAYVMVPVRAVERYAVNYRAEQAGVTPEERLRQTIAEKLG